MRTRYPSKSKVFANLYLELHNASEQIAEPAFKVEVRRMANGVEFFVNHLHQTILVRFPGMADWLDFAAVRKLRTAIMQGQISSTLDDSELEEVRRMLNIRNGGAK